MEENIASFFFYKTVVKKSEDTASFMIFVFMFVKKRLFNGYCGCKSGNKVFYSADIHWHSHRTETHRTHINLSPQRNLFTFLLKTHHLNTDTHTCQFDLSVLLFLSFNSLLPTPLSIFSPTCLHISPSHIYPPIVSYLPSSPLWSCIFLHSLFFHPSFLWSYRSPLSDLFKIWPLHSSGH